MPPGTYRVVFEGGDLDVPYETEVTIETENVKLDVIDEGGSVAASLSAAMVPNPAILPELDPIRDDNTLAMFEEEEDTTIIF